MSCYVGSYVVLKKCASRSAAVNLTPLSISTTGGPSLDPRLSENRRDLPRQSCNVSTVKGETASGDSADLLILCESAVVVNKTCEEEGEEEHVWTGCAAPHHSLVFSSGYSLFSSDLNSLFSLISDNKNTPPHN